jgi:hypothetical protein
MRKYTYLLGVKILYIILKKVWLGNKKKLFLQPQSSFVRWCNGSTAVFGSA